MRQIKITALLLSLLLLCACGQSAVSKEATVVPEETSVAETTSVSTEATSADAIEVGEGLLLTALTELAGNYPEDGSDEYRESMLCATFVNNNAATLQYAKVNVTIGGAVHTFELTTIPPGEGVLAFDTGGEAAPASAEDVSAAAEYLVFFAEEPSREENRLAITIHDGSLTVENISGEDIDREIYVYFKNTYESRYLGGITYRVRVGTLKAGETVGGYSSHASAAVSEVMFVSYGS